VRLRFLGTGASGGTRGEGRSRRRESSLVIGGRTVLLVDVKPRLLGSGTGVRSHRRVPPTHGHRDAIDGLPQLRRCWFQPDARCPINILLNNVTAEVIRDRCRRLEHCRLHVPPGSLEAWLPSRPARSPYLTRASLVFDSRAAIWTIDRPSVQRKRRATATARRRSSKWSHPAERALGNCRPGIARVGASLGSAVPPSAAEPAVCGSWLRRRLSDPSRLEVVIGT
jgi:hypothetical protein